MEKYHWYKATYRIKNKESLQSLQNVIHIILHVGPATQIYYFVISVCVLSQYCASPKLPILCLVFLIYVYLSDSWSYPCFQCLQEVEWLIENSRDRTDTENLCILHKIPLHSCQERFSLLHAKSFLRMLSNKYLTFVMAKSIACTQTQAIWLTYRHFFKLSAFSKHRS